MSHFIAPVISELFQKSIMECIFPSGLKIGRVIPVFKHGKKTEMKNYRPITTLPILAIGFLAEQNTSDAPTDFLD